MLCLLCGCGSAYSADVTTLIAKGDSFYRRFDNRGAEAVYLKALAIEPDNVEIIWRLSRAQVDIGEHLPEAEQEAYFDKALEYADQAIAADPKSCQAHLRRAIALGKTALYKGVFENIGLVKKIKASAETSIALNPEEPTPHYVLARTHHKLSEKQGIALKLLGLSWASREVARSEYLRAIELDDTFIMYHYDYGQLLIAMDNKAEARVEMKKVLELPVRDEDDEALKRKARVSLKLQL